ncbi:MAG: type II toxin-antitoxin system RelE/ParE family toxin [Desulfobacula sp.]|jgi:mRNA interferase RelE/StbE|nr:type II toxin-antitoxin system RelE/ParE family toxin [Desulfobacula sp.]MBT6340819.1 type II toxin-antitoxin system RelE/ParE family toxin [Desulfobacula sp.]MBT7261814.1 type II toxin-antitoxin system RelE/ParE family toxin [Desulfobacula sp.]
MKFKIIFHPDAARKISELDNRQKSLVLKQIKKLSLTPGNGKQLGNKQGLDLSGYRKMYADRKKIRIVYKIVKKMILIQIIAIGKRDSMKVYKKAANRIQDNA